MMMCENDKLNIPEVYKKMTVSELRREKERIYMGIRQQKNMSNKKKECSREIEIFRF